MTQEKTVMAILWIFKELGIMYDGIGSFNVVHTDFTFEPNIVNSGIEHK